MLQAHYCDATVHTPVFCTSWNVALLWRYCSNYGIDYCYPILTYQKKHLLGQVSIRHLADMTKPPKPLGLQLRLNRKCMTPSQGLNAEDMGYPRDATEMIRLRQQVDRGPSVC